MVEPCKLAGADPADLFHRGDMLVIESGDGGVDVPVLLGQANSHGAAVDARAGMMQVAGFDQFLDITSFLTL